MPEKILFLDRDGILVREPADRQIDRFDKLALMPDVIVSLVQLRDAGYRFVMVTNQDGLGTDRFPEASFRGPHELLLEILSSQGVAFEAVRICPHLAEEGCPCRKPGLLLVRDYLARDLDRRRSAVVGDRDTDLLLAENMGLVGLKVGAGTEGSLAWPEIARRLLGTPRRGEVARRTRETAVRVRVDLDGGGRGEIDTGIGFFDHMLEQLAKHGGLDLSVEVRGDLEVDEHHVVEDTALALGAALRRALGDKAGIGRYGFVLPMDDSLAQVALDLSGRAYLAWSGRFERERVGELPTELVPHFFRSLADALGATLHLEVRGDNAHHMIEASFKAFARALRQACAPSGSRGIPSTKGAL